MTDFTEKTEDLCQSREGQIELNCTHEITELLEFGNLYISVCTLCDKAL